MSLRRTNVGTSTPAKNNARPLIDPDLDFIACNKDERVVAAVCGISVKGVRRLRGQGRGPRYRKVGALCRYSLADVFAWIDALPSGGESAGAGRSLHVYSEGGSIHDGM